MNRFERVIQILDNADGGLIQQHPGCMEQFGEGSRGTSLSPRSSSVVRWSRSAKEQLQTW